MNCPICNSASLELLECEVCMKVGCVKCTIKRSGQWVCNLCKAGTAQEQAAGNVFSMFG